MAIRALLIDDDARLAELLGTYLAPHEVILTHAPNGRAGLNRLTEGGVDLVLLDVMMPGIDGLDVLRRIREGSRIPVIMLTARGDEADRVVGLELGADDYLGKPVYPRELLARIRALMRRVTPEPEGTRLRVADLELDPASRTATIGDDELGLTALEFDLLCALAERAGRVLSRQALWEAAGRGDVAVADRTVDVHIARLRAKLGEQGDPRRLKTVRGAGYVLVRELG